MGKIVFTNRTSEVHFEGELKDILRELSNKENLRNAYLPEENMPDCDFHEVKLPFATLSHSNLKGCNFKNATLYFVHFHGCDLRDCDFSGADLTHADFKFASIQGAKFTGAYMKDVTGIPQDQFPKDALLEDAPHVDMPSCHHWPQKRKGSN